jgi:hypothetical protein
VRLRFISPGGTTRIDQRHERGLARRPGRRLGHVRATSWPSREGQRMLAMLAAMSETQADTAVRPTARSRLTLSPLLALTGLRAANLRRYS